MPINRTVAIVLNADGKPIKPSDIAEASNITTGQASTELIRLVRMGIAQRVGRGEYILFDKQKAVDFLNKTKHNNTTKDTIGVSMGAAPETLVRPHRVWYKAKVLNAPIIKEPIRCGITRLGAWRFWEPNQFSKFYEKLIELGTGTYATVRYAEGQHKRSITVKCEAVMVNGQGLTEHMAVIEDSVERSLRTLSREDGIQVGLIQLTCDHHFAIPLAVTDGWRLPPPGHIKINDFWWMDSSTGWPEVETHLLAQAKRLVELPDKVDALPDAVRKAIRDTMAEMLMGRNAVAHEEPEGGYA